MTKEEMEVLEVENRQFAKDTFQGLFRNLLQLPQNIRAEAIDQAVDAIIDAAMMKFTIYIKEVKEENGNFT